MAKYKFEIKAPATTRPTQLLINATLLEDFDEPDGGVYKGVIDVDSITKELVVGLAGVGEYMDTGSFTILSYRGKNLIKEPVEFSVNKRGRFKITFELP